MPIPSFRKSGFVLILLVAFHFSVIQIFHSSDKFTGQVSGLQKHADELQTKGYYDKAIPIIKEVLALRRAASGDKNAEVAQILDQLGELYYLAGKYPDAESFLKESLSIRMEIFGPNHTETAINLYHFGMLNELVAKYAKAEYCLNSALEIWETAYGKAHPVVAKTLVTLAKVQINMKNRDNAETLLNRALAIQEKSLGPEHPDLSKTLNTLAWMYLATNQPEKAEPYCRRALDISEKDFGPEHPYIAESLDYLGRVYESRKEYDKSIEVNKRALTIRENFLGPDHPDVGMSLNDLALSYFGLKEYDTAKSLFIKSLSIQEKAHGPEHPYLVASLNNIEYVHEILGDYAGAVTYVKRSIEITEKIFGPENTIVADLQKVLAVLYYQLGDFDKAYSLLLQTLKIFEQNFGPDDMRVAINFKLIASIFYSIGEYAKAETFYIKSIDICEKNSDAALDFMASNLISLGVLYTDFGDYKKAETMFLAGQEIMGKISGPQDPYVARLLDNKAMLYERLGDFAKAKALYLQTLDIREKAFGPEHPETALSLNKLGCIYEALGDYDNAKSLLYRAIKIQLKALGPTHPTTINTLVNLAMVYLDLKDFEKAEQLLQHVLEVKKETIGTENKSFAYTLSKLATLYKAQGEYAKAEPLYNQSIGILEKTFGPENQIIADCYSHLSNLYDAIGNYEKEYEIITRNLEIKDKILDQVMGFASDDHKLKFVTMINESLYDFLNLVDQHFIKDPEKRKHALDVWLKRKGSILDIQKHYQEAVISGGNPESAKLFEELSGVRSRLSKLAFAQPGKEGDKNYNQKIFDLIDDKNYLEGRLSRLSQPFAMQQQIAEADCEKIARILSPRSVLVEFARFNDTETRPGRYISFILHSGDGSKITMIDLGDAAIIDGTVTQYKKEISGSGNAKSEAVTETSQKLYDLVFKPLLNDLGTAKEIYISPDGNLNLMPFEVLQGHDGKFLIEEFTFNYLASGRDIVGFGKNPDNGGKCILMGDPDFDLGLDEKMAVLKQNNVKSDTGMLVANRSANLNEVSFEPLPYAKEELDAICGITGQEESEIYMDKYAIEEILMNKPSPQILHLATHGFFLDDQNLPSSGRGWQTAKLPDKVDHSPGRANQIIYILNPLIRSGILLAGAKRSLMSGDTGKNDGIVTAEKILGLNLHGTKMVVLSACDTGLGEVESGEGVFGLRRAFTQAGAKSIVMSLWKVPDLETKELMVQFYRNIKTGTMNRCHALRQAVLAQMKIVKERQGYANPRYWGAFVFMGEP